MTVETPFGKRALKIEAPKIDEFNAIQKEFELFYRAISEDIDVPVSLYDGVKALELALKIDAIIEENIKQQRDSNIIP